MRKFILVNARGDTWDITKTDSFFHSVAGLGQERRVTYEQIGNQYVETQVLLRQKNITGKIAFTGYQEYADFCRFIQHRPLTLKYKAEKDTYLIDVEVEKLTKTELETIGLQCDVALKSLTTWYVMTYAENVHAGSGKEYPLSYPYTYSDNAMGEISIQIDSVEDNPVRLSILGPCINPTWTMRTNGLITATGSVTCNIPEGNRLVVDSTRIPFMIAEYDAYGNLVTDLYQNSDFGTKRFLTAGYGENLVTIVHEGSQDIRAILEVMVEYACT